jgi:hypothetical protein
MADTKITSLQPPQVVTNPATDVLPIVNIADPLMATSGSTRKITVNQLLGAGGTATLASATITGDLTVRTNQLIVNSTGVGVGTTPSAWSGIGPAIQVEQASLLSEASNQLYLTANGYFAGGQWNYINNASADQYYQISGSHVWRSGTGGAGGTAIGWSTLMTLNSTGLGVGGAPSDGRLLTIGSLSSVSATASAINIYSSKATLNITADGATNAAGTTISYSWANGGQGPLIFRNASIANVMTLDASGNVGVGVTPSAGKGCLQLSSGINFPATQVASSDANTLDDYIERTWTGTLKGSVSDPTTPVTATGRITKIGRKVMAEITFSNVSTVGASGAISITGLPYTNNASVNGVGIASLNLIGTFTGSPVSFITIGGSTIELYADVSNGASTQITHNAGVARFMTIQITYTV